MQVKLRCEYFCDDSTKDCDIGAEYAIAKSTSGYPGVRIFFYCCWHKKNLKEILVMMIVIMISDGCLRKMNNGRD